MAYCGPRGIARSDFLRWDLDDQDAAMAWQSYENARCGSCGHHPDEPTRHLHVDVCPGCVDVQRTRESGALEETRGSHLRWAGGGAGGCQRCIDEAAFA